MNGQPDGCYGADECYDADDCYEAVDILAADFLARYRDGDRPSVDEYSRRHPELSDRIQKMFPLVLSVEKVKLDQQAAGDGSATLAGRSFKRLADFSIVREIGRGGMGIVFEAEQESLGRRVAIKVLPKQCLLDDQALARFHSEAKVAASMHHSNIVPIFGTGETDGTHYLVMQLVKGRSLDKVLADEASQLGDHDIARIGEQVADALAYANASGVLHRDIKPANILIEENGTAQITDFGLARNIGDDPTETHTLSGSLRYMAPERFRGMSDGRSDVYSLGLTLYETLAGRPAFDETDPHQLIESIKNWKPQSLRAIRPDIPADLETIVLKAINFESSQRYASAADMRDDLQRFLSDEPIQARRISPLKRTFRWCRRNPRLATSVAIAATALTIATVASSAGYLLTSMANQRTSNALRQSEQTVSLALQSLDGVVELTSTPRSAISETGLDETEQAGIILNPSPQSAEILESVQPLYERLLEQSPTRPDIVIQMTEASLRLAQIQHQLGRTGNAIETLQSSIQLLSVRGHEAQLAYNDQQRFLARLNNKLGAVYSAEMQFESADQAYEAAIASASSLPSDDTLAQVELVHAHLSLGDPPPQRRREALAATEKRNKAEEHLDKAWEILESFKGSAEKSRTVAILNANIRLAMSRMESDMPVKRSYINEAIEILQNRLRDFPDDTIVRFALVETLADVRVRRDSLSSAQHQRVERRLQQALVVLKPLRNRFPETPIFAVAEMHIWHKLSAVSRLSKDLMLAEEQLLNALKIQTTLVDAWPNSMPHRCWRALLYRSLAELSLQKQDGNQAKQQIENAIKDLDAIDSDSANHPFVLRTKQIIREAQIEIHALIAPDR